jgi:hypothetical protein
MGRQSASAAGGAVQGVRRPASIHNQAAVRARRSSTTYRHTTAQQHYRSTEAVVQLLLWLQRVYWVVSGSVAAVAVAVAVAVEELLAGW